MEQTQVHKKTGSPKIIKKYGNRKLYDTEQSSYVVLKDIEKMIRNKEDVQIIDNETQDDITISTLTQIIFSSEKKSKVSPPVNVLKSIISEGDGSFSAYLAKMGVFSVDESGKDERSSVNKAGSKKADKATPSLEQKITTLMSSGDGVISQSGEELVPELPGTSLS